MHLEHLRMDYHILIAATERFRQSLPEAKQTEMLAHFADEEWVDVVLSDPDLAYRFIMGLTAKLERAKEDCSRCSRFFKNISLYPQRHPFVPPEDIHELMWASVIGHIRAASAGKAYQRVFNAIREQSSNAVV